MSTDLRDALADLATEAPALDVADRAIALGRSRRRRHVLGAVATVAGLAVVAVVAPVLTTAPPLRWPGAASQTAGFEPNIQPAPWRWLDDTLPRTLAEP